jgi:AcrR family transcriptional regulator
MLTSISSSATQRHGALLYVVADWTERKVDMAARRTPGKRAGSAAPPPTDQLTQRGLRTRSSLIDAAARVFARDGFLDARITDICKAAGVAYGTFYTYFTSKEEIFHEVIMSLQEDMAGHEPTAAPAEGATPWELVEAANRRYVRAYQRNAKLMATLEQVATFNDDVRRMRLELRGRFVNRNAKAIARWQEAGLADPDIDPRYAANALGTMVDRFTYTWFVLGEPFEDELAIETLTRLWLQALGIEHGRHSRPRPAPPRE